MSPRVDPAQVRPGDALPEVAETIDRLDLVRYAGASGDFNPIHWNDEVAKAVGLPGVIAHGMYSMAVATRMLTGWAGDPAAIKRLKVRFSSMIEPGQTLTAKGEVAEVDGRRVLVRFHAEDEKGEKVLSKGEAELELELEPQPWHRRSWGAVGGASSPAWIGDCGLASSQEPREVNELLTRRRAARERRDFATADAIRDQLRQAGWLVRDTPDGPELDPAPPYETLDPAAVEPCWDKPDRYEVSVVVHVAGWPEDVARATRALAAHHRHLAYEVLLVEDGAGEATGRALEDLARDDPHVQALHLDPAIGFGAAMNLAMGQALGHVLVWLDPHVEATGDLLGPLLAALAQPGAGLAGGWGVTTTTMLEFEADDGPEVDAIEGYLLAVPRALAAQARVDPKDRYYRNADLDYSFAVRALGSPTDRGTPSGSPEPLRAVRVEVPAIRHRHRGFHDTDPRERDRASRKNYDRFLGRWKGRTELLTRGFRGYHRHR